MWQVQNDDGWVSPEAWVLCKDGAWRPSVPFPFFCGPFYLVKKCHCGKKFLFQHSYERHYQQSHLRRTDGNS